MIIIKFEDYRITEAAIPFSIELTFIVSSRYNLSKRLSKGWFLQIIPSL